MTVCATTWANCLQALKHAGATLRADWIRLELLRRHGGIWLDASTLLTAPLDWVLQQQQRSGSDLVAYYLDRYTTDAQFPIVENWFLAAPPQSALVADLQHEFTHTVLPLGGAGYVAYLQQLGNYEQLRQGIDLPNYLSMHLALQRLLRSGAKLPPVTALRGRWPLPLSCAGPMGAHRPKDPLAVLACGERAAAADQIAQARSQTPGPVSGARSVPAREHLWALPVSATNAMSRRRKTKIEKWFSFNRYRRRFGAHALAAGLLGEDTEALKSTLVAGDAAEYAYGSLPDLQAHLQRLRQEFIGQPELLYHHAALIVLIRREAAPEQNFARFKQLWLSEQAFLSEHLDLRWLVAACDTFIDHDPDAGLRATLMNAVLLVNTIKLQETERFLQGPRSHPIGPSRSPRCRLGGLA
jgi:hypothetical protein